MIGGISVTQLLILLVIVMLVFGTKRLRNIGSDLGSAVKGFRKGIEDDPKDKEPEEIAKAESTVVEASPKG
jgi:sec-independent protein translocase protein TatA